MPSRKAKRAPARPARLSAIAVHAWPSNAVCRERGAVNSPNCSANVRAASGVVTEEATDANPQENFATRGSDIAHQPPVPAMHPPGDRSTTWTPRLPAAGPDLHYHPATLVGDRFDGQRGQM